MIKTFTLAFIFTFACSIDTYARNVIYADNIKSLTAIVNNNWMSSPLLTLGSDDVMQVGFDEMSHDYHRYVYRVEHCEKDWTVSEGIFESDYLAGFNGLPIDDFRNSINTNIQYTHYMFTFPDSRCSVKMSGNYRMTIHDDDNGGDIVAEVRFRVVEPLMTPTVEMTANTDVDVNRTHQQIRVKVDFGNITVTDPDEEISIVVTQNNREETAREDIRADYRNSRGLAWLHNKSLIFDAGNEYHKFEVLDVSHPTMGIDNIYWDGHAYQVWPFACNPRRNYLYDEDANGAFFIRNSDNVEIDYTCEYVYVNYELQSPFVGELLIDGVWATDSDRSDYKMEYDVAEQKYSITLLQKLGYYNYMFITPEGGLAPTEGSFYQTENSYQVYIYYKGKGARTWKLVGFRSL